MFDAGMTKYPFQLRKRPKMFHIFNFVLPCQLCSYTFSYTTHNKLL